MRPDFDPEEEKAPSGEIDQNRLVRQVWTAVPADPWDEVIDAQCDRHDHPFEVAELTRDAARKDGFARGKQVWGRFSLWHSTGLLLRRFRWVLPCAMRRGFDLDQTGLRHMRRFECVGFDTGPSETREQGKGRYQTACLATGPSGLG